MDIAQEIQREARWGHSPDQTIITALILFTLIFRMLTLMMIHTGVDERDYWTAGKALVSDAPYPEVQHRTIRWPIILPVAASQLIFGTHPNVYYVIPLIAGCLIVGLIYTTGRRLGGRLVGFLGALGFTLFPYMIRGGSQIRPEIFGVLFMLLSIRFLYAHGHPETQTEARLQVPAVTLGLQHRLSKTDIDLLFIAGALFLAYLTKITNIFFVPGVLVYLWLRPRLSAPRGVVVESAGEESSGLRDAIVVGSVLLGFFFFETILYGMFRGQWLGRAGIILNNHLTQEFESLPSFWALFRRYAPKYLPVYWSGPLALFPLAAFYLWKKNQRRTAALFLLPVLSFLIPFTFAVSSLDPVVPAERFIHRYFMPTLPSVLLLEAKALTTALRSIPGPRIRSVRLKRFVGYLGRLSPTRVVVVVLVLSLLSIGVIFAVDLLPESVDRYYTSPLDLDEHPLALNVKYLRDLNAAYFEKVPIIARTHSGGDNALKTVSHFYLLPEAIVPGPYPEPGTASIDGQEYRYLGREDLPPIRLATPVVLVERNPFRVEWMSFADALLTIQQPERPE